MLKYLEAKTNTGMMEELRVKVPQALLKGVKCYASEVNVDEEVAVREMLQEGLKRRVLRLYSEGKISIWKAAKMLNVSHWEIIDLAKELGYEMGVKGKALEKAYKNLEDLRESKKEKA